MDKQTEVYTVQWNTTQRGEGLTDDTAMWTTLKCLMLDRRSQTQGGLHVHLYVILEKTKV